MANLQTELFEEIGLILEPLIAASQSELSRNLLFQDIGLDLDVSSDLSIDELINWLMQLADNYKNLERVIENPPETISEFQETLDTSSQLFSAIRHFPNIINQPELQDLPKIDKLGQDLIESLLVRYFETWHPLLNDLLVLLTIIQSREDAKANDVILDKSGRVVRFPIKSPKLKVERIAALLSNSATLLRDEYLGLDQINTVEQAQQITDKLFPRLARVLQGFGINAHYSIKSIYGLDFGEVGNELMAGMMTCWVSPELAESSFGVTLALSPTDRGNLGLVIIPFGDSEFSQIVGDWIFTISFTAGIQALASGSEGLTLIGASETTSVDARFTALKLPETEDAVFLIGSATGSRLEVGQFLISGNASFDSNGRDYGLLLEVGSATLIVSPSDGDGFLQKVLPTEGMRANFDLAIGWSNTKGFYFRGSAGLEAVLPVQVSLFGALSVNSIYLAIKTGDADIQTEVSASVSVEIGPIQAVTERIGLHATFAFPEEGGNLGLLDLDFGFKPPTGIGLTISAEGITGGGFLSFDPPNYAGAMQLFFEDEFALSAFGLITTQLPDGRDGFSLVIQILAEFQPIQLGLGFALTGVGGLIGINRQLHEDNMRQAIKNHSLDLFPQNPIKDAVKLIGTIQAILPPKEGFHVFGPMAKLFWGGSIKLVEFEVGVFIQIGGPLKVAIIGRAWSILPSEETPLLVINVDVFGLIDLGEERIAIDAVLFDSKILKFTLSGEMALRANWSRGEENFALSVGGFHPRFQAIPPGFPSLRRLMVSIGSGNPRLSLSMYLAITTNTLQVGAQLDLWAKKAGFTITGGAGFDALFTFSPFSFLVLINMWVGIKRSFVDLTVRLELELSGPNPIIVVGYAKFKVGWFSKKVRFRKEFGQKVPEPLPVVSPLAALISELSNKSNIRFRLPAWASGNLIFTEAAESRIDPLAEIIISQNAVPLELNLDRFGGGTPPAAERKLKVKAGLGEEQETPIKAMFAASQFKNWSEEQRLSAKPFEQFKSGIQLGGEYVIPEEHGKERKIEFETVLRESKNYLASLPEDNSKKVLVRFICVWQPTVQEASMINNWSLFGSMTYFTPSVKAVDENNPNYVQVVEPSFTITGDEFKNGQATRAIINDAVARDMTFTEAMEVAARKKGTTIIRNQVDVESTVLK